ncbi:hypothetical protein [Mycolicibacterium fortuitum]|uniref:hypothetical protein n=1 Tax=Mycolicibacterium fortuitum TaxID=1766 RepID=UPI0014905070|nr:hypothetical protein [Mycolicibacterium fortuitum]
MSADYLVVYPTDPKFVPSEDRAAAALAVFRVVMRDDIEISERRFNGVGFEAAGPDMESVSCPACGVELARNPENMDWLVAELERVWTPEEGYWPLDVTTPCCGSSSSLNDLVYNPPQGFASWSLSARNPTYEMDDWERELVGAALGMSVRHVYQRV